MKTIDYSTKVCGMRDHANIKSISTLEIHWMGFIFYPGSKRFVGLHYKMPQLPVAIKSVGVFVDADQHEVWKTVMEHNLHAVQLHGDESPTYCSQLKAILPAHVFIFKSFPIETTEDFDMISEYDFACDMYVFDTKVVGHGGSGKKWDHSILAEQTIEKPFLLSGGISPSDNLTELCNLHHNCVGVDINSRFEISAALKDKKLIKTFLDDK